MLTDETRTAGQQPQPQAEEQAEVIQVPMSAIGGAKEGDTVRFTVDSLDTESGMATVSPAEAMENEAPSGTDGMASEFSKENMQKGT